MHRQADSQPNKRPKKDCGKGSVAFLENSTQLGYVFQDIEPPKCNSIFRKGTKSYGFKRSVRFSKGTLFTTKDVDRKKLFRSANLKSAPK